MMKTHGMIDRLAQPFEDLDPAPRVYGCAKHNLLKKIDREVLRAGKSKQNTGLV
jgi:hypothetical protein